MEKMKEGNNVIIVIIPKRSNRKSPEMVAFDCDLEK